MDHRDFTTLPVRDRQAVMRMIVALGAAVGPAQRWDRIVEEAARYRAARGWFVFSYGIVTPDSSVRKVARRAPRYVDIIASPASPVKKLDF